jgi:uncharacterized membrane protein
MGGAWEALSVVCNSVMGIWCDNIKMYLNERVWVTMEMGWEWGAASIVYNNVMGNLTGMGK